MTKLYVDNMTHTLTLDKSSNRMKPALFSTRSAVFDGEWTVEGYSIKELHDRRVHGFDHYYSTGLSNLTRASMNSFEFITCHGLSNVFEVNRSTVYRAVKNLPHLKNRGILYMPCKDGILAVFHYLIKNVYVSNRPRSSVLPQEEFHFLQSNEAAGRIINDIDSHQNRLDYLMEGHSLPIRTEEILATEKGVRSRNRYKYRIRWVGAIPFVVMPTLEMKNLSIMITFCGYSGIALGNHRKEISIYSKLMEVQIVSPMFPKRIDQCGVNLESMHSDSMGEENHHD